MYQKTCFIIPLAIALYVSLIVDAAAQERRATASPGSNHLQETLGAVGPHHREWVVPDARDGSESRYIQLQTGLMRQLDSGEWVESSSEIELFRGGAIARKARHQVIFSPDSTDPNGVFDVLMPGGKRLRGLCVGIAYTEKSTGRSVFIAETRSVAGELVGLNEVVYRDCFEGEVRGDLVYRVTAAGVAQDVVLRSRVPAFENYGFEGEVALEIWSEFLEAPEADKHEYERRRRNGQLAADCIIDFGSMRIGEGRAFPARHGDAMDDADLADQIPVHKAYELLEGSLFLIESVPYADAVESIAKIPGLLEARKIDKGEVEKALARVGESAEGSKSKPASAGPTKSGESEDPGRRNKPVSYIAKNTERPSGLKIARVKKTDVKLAGYVVDFDLTLGGGTQTDFTFKADTTYYVTGTVYLNGRTTVEGGTVIKFANTNSPQLIVNTTGSLDMKTAPYNPAIFCAKDDNTVGSTIAGSSGSPSGTYAQTAIGYWVASPMPNPFEPFGNFHYGATGSAFGFRSGVLLRMAGAAQKAADTSKDDPKFGTGAWFGLFGGTPPFKDDPRDQYWIMMGIAYYHYHFNNPPPEWKYDPYAHDDISIIP